MAAVNLTNSSYNLNGEIWAITPTVEGFASAAAICTVSSSSTLVSSIVISGGAGLSTVVTNTSVLSPPPALQCETIIPATATAFGYPDGALVSDTVIPTTATATVRVTVISGGAGLCTVVSDATLSPPPSFTANTVIPCFATARPTITVPLACDTVIPCLASAVPVLVYAFTPALGAWVIFESDGTDSGTVASIGRRWQRQGETEQLV